MTDTDRELSQERLERVLRALDIRVGVSSDGKYTVTSEQEPIFCFVRDSEAQIEDVVKDTIVSYVAKFYDVKNFKVDLRRIEAESLPRVEVPTPVSRLKFSDGFYSGEREAVCA